MSVQVESISSLNSDIFYDVLKRVDGTTLASAACACAAFFSVAKEERIWADVCHSMWPSTNRDDVRNLIKSVGGFRKFYADCYPLIVNKDIAVISADSYLDYPEEWPEADFYGELEEGDSTSPSDFVCLIDLSYKGKPIFSKVLWGVTETDVQNRWFLNSPFHIDLFGNSDEETSNIALSVKDGVPPIKSVTNERKEGKLWKELRDDVRLSWIIVNKKVKQAVNVSSWIPLGVQRHWPTDKDFLVRFGSVLPAECVLPCRVVECILQAKFRMVEDNSSGHISLELTQVSMQLEDMESSVNGRNSLLVLGKAFHCRRTTNYSEVLDCCNLFSKLRNEIKELKLRNESRIDKLCILSGIAAVFTFWFCIL